MPPTIMTARELAAKLDAKYDDVLMWARRGYVPSMKGADGRVWFLFEQVVDALRARQEAGRPESPEAAVA